jgi:hypothetical protein
MGTYGVGAGAAARCVGCPLDECTVPDRDAVPATCSGTTGCNDPVAGVARCSCGGQSERNPGTSECVACPAGQKRPESGTEPVRGLDTLNNYTLWEAEQGVCEALSTVNLGLVVGLPVAILGVVVAVLAMSRYRQQRTITQQRSAITSQTLIIKSITKRNTFSPGRSKFGDAVAFIDDLLADTLDKPDQIEKLTLVRQCLVDTGDGVKHVPANLAPDRRWGLSKQSSQYILNEFAGVSTPSGILTEKRPTFTLASFEADSQGISLGNDDAYCLPEFQQLEREKQLKLFCLLSFSNLKQWDFNIFDVSAVDRENTLLFVSWAVICSPYAQLAMARELGPELVTSGDISEGYMFSENCLRIHVETFCDYVRVVQSDYKVGALAYIDVNLL